MDQVAGGLVGVVGSMEAGTVPLVGAVLFGWAGVVQLGRNGGRWVELDSANGAALEQDLGKGRETARSAPLRYRFWIT